MSPQEKAEELVDKFTAIEDGEMYIGKAKQCALIAVDEILNYDIKAKCESQFIIEQKIESYWQEVKQEIEKL